MKNIKNQKGSITIFVLIGLLFMSSFLVISLTANVNKAKMLKEQYNIISGLYNPNDNNETSYTEAYTALRNKTKQVTTTTVEDKNSIELEETYGGEIENLKIYGRGDYAGLNLNNECVGDLIINTNNENFGKYVISIIITKNDKNVRYSIYLDKPLQENEYIDYANKQVVRNTGKKEIIDLPKIELFEDGCTITVSTEQTPSKIELEYLKYTILENN